MSGLWNMFEGINRLMEEAFGQTSFDDFDDLGIIAMNMVENVLIT